MVIPVRFHFDPLCPWAWQASKWMREVKKVRDIDIDWRLFSLELINNNGNDPLADVHATGAAALRTLVLVRREGGNDAVGRVYEALGTRVHETPSQELDHVAMQFALEEEGLDPSMFERALSDESTAEDVRSEHDAAVSEVGAFGVPTIVLGSGGMFGPVIAKAPTGESAGELWDHVEWLIRQDGFFELKRERDLEPGG
jgi:predicted DsbA family dithiol-disulfide isomerase